jgi:hypothetical protein
VTIRTFDHGKPLLPYVFTVLIVMVAYGTVIGIPFGMLDVGEPYGSFPIGFIDRVVDDDLFGSLLDLISRRSGGWDGQKPSHHAGE